MRKRNAAGKKAICHICNVSSLYDIYPPESNKRENIADRVYLLFFCKNVSRKEYEFDLFSLTIVGKKPFFYRILVWCSITI